MFALALPILLSFPLALEDELSDEAKLAAGWKLQDLEWISPEEVGRMEQGLWKCGDAWMTIQEANAYHAEPGKWWRIPGEHTVIWTTLPRVNAEIALSEMELAYADLARFYGIEPTEKPVVVALRTGEQFGGFTGRDTQKGVAGKSVIGLGDMHGAYFADNWFDEAGEPVRASVAYWNTDDEQVAGFGKLWIRHATGQSYAELIDPSPEALEELDVSELDLRWFQKFWDEKKLPDWIRFGAASYVERYFTDNSEWNNGNPNWPREWSVANLKTTGLSSVDRIIEGEPRPDQVPATEKWLKETGLLVAFVLDGNDKAMTKAHEKFVKAMTGYQKKPNKATAKGVTKAAEGLAKALEKNEKKMKEFAGF